VKRAIFLSLIVLLLSSCAPPAKFLVRRDLEKRGDEFKFDQDQKSVIWIVLDGVNATVFRRMLERGELPNFYKYVYRRGAYTFQAIASHVPSTYPNIASQLTGKFPGHIGVPNNHYLDEEHEDRLNLVEFPGILKARKLLKDETTIFNYLQAMKLYSVSVTDLVATSANVHVVDLFKVGIKEINRQWKDIDRKTYADMMSIVRETTKTNQLPALLYAHMVGVDSNGHVHGVNSRAYRQALVYLDREFGKLVRLLKERKYYDNVAFVLSSDHGQIPVHNRFDLEKYIYSVVHDKPKRYCFRNKCKIDDGRIKDVIVLSGAERDAFIYCGIDDLEDFYRSIRGGEWKHRPTISDLTTYEVRPGSHINLIEKLVEERAVGLVFVRESSSKFHVFSNRGHAVIKRKIIKDRPFYAYDVRTGRDPLELKLERTPSSEEYLSSRDWLVLTEHSTYPDAVAQIPELFQTPKTGDLIVYAAPGYSFGKKNKGAHGGGTRPEMYTAFLFAADGIPHRELGPFRTVDILPTILYYLGLEVNPPTRIDGVPNCLYSRNCP